MALKVVDKYLDFEDKELVKLFKNEGNLNVLGALYNRYMGLTYGLCLKYFKNTDDAKDAVMDIFELLVKRLPNHEVEHFKSWLYRLASNHCLDKLRSRSRKIDKHEEAKIVYSSEAYRLNDEGLQKELDLNNLEKCLDGLIEEQKKCVDLFYLKKKSYKEVSEELDISWSETRSFIQNGRRNLKNCMDEQNAKK